MAMSQRSGSEALGALIRARREELGMSRRQLVEATGLSYPYVSQLETGYRLPSSTALRNLAGALQMSTDELVSVMPEERSATGRGRDRSGWFHNDDHQPSASSAPATTGGSPPSTRGSRPSTRRLRRDTAAVVNEAVALLATVPPKQRLSALSRVQEELMAGLVDEEVRRAGRRK